MILCFLHPELQINNHQTKKYWVLLYYYPFHPLNTSKQNITKLERNNRMYLWCFFVKEHCLSDCLFFKLLNWFCLKGSCNVRETNIHSQTGPKFCPWDYFLCLQSSGLFPGEKDFYETWNLKQTILRRELIV